MDTQPTAPIAEPVARSRAAPSRRAAFAVLGACLVLDGFDVQAMGYVAPAIIAEWGIPRAAMGPVFSAGLLGLFLGSVAFSMLADRIGRRPVLLGATAWFGALTLLAARAGSTSELLALRFLAGLGLGAIMPNATALVGEYTPPQRRIAVMMVVTNGFMVGAVLGGVASAGLVPAHGWRSVFLAGGLLPLALLPAGLAAIATPGLPLGALFALAFAVGWGIFAGQPGLNALAATSYPTDLRSTGIGAALGIGRFGAIFGPVAASALMLRGWSTAEILRTAALPALASAAVVVAMGRSLAGARREPERKEACT
jgi:MFS family permease